MRDETVASLTLGMRALGLDAGSYFVRATRDLDGESPNALLARFWHHATSDMRDAALPARVGLSVPFGSFGLLDYLAASSPTLDSALRAITRHMLAVTDAASYVFERPLMRMAHRYPTPSQNLFMIAVLVARARTVVGSEAVSRIELTVPEGASLEGVFGAEVLVGRSVDQVHFRHDALDAPLLDANPGLHSVLLKTGADLGFDRPVDSLSARVRARLPGVFRGHRPTVDELARSLGYSRRDFTRKLSMEGCTLREVLDDWAKARSLARLEAGVSISDVAEELGYADQASFTRAFRRWTGVSPGSYVRRTPPHASR